MIHQNISHTCFKSLMVDPQSRLLETVGVDVLSGKKVKKERKGKNKKDCWSEYSICPG